MIVWGGKDGGPSHFNTGGRYNPSTDAWTATSTTNAPNARVDHTAVWTGSEMIVWGGDNWQRLFLTRAGDIIPAPTVGRPQAPPMLLLAETAHTAVWTGSEMIVWGGFEGTFRLNTGGRYDPVHR